MKTIQKYLIPINTNYFTLKLPETAEILTVQVQTDQIYLFCLVNTDFPRTFKHTFRLAVTQQPITDDILNYIGTFQINGGQVTGHLFEVIK